jgi:hypothetical protein
MSIKHRVLNFIFHRIFGDVNIEARVYTTPDFIVVADLAVQTRFGSFTFPFFQKQLPAPGTGYSYDGELHDPEDEDFEVGKLIH